MNKRDIISYLNLAGITKLNPTESVADAIKFVNGLNRVRVGCKPPDEGGPLSGFYTSRESFVRIKTRKEWSTN